MTLALTEDVVANGNVFSVVHLLLFESCDLICVVALLMLLENNMGFGK